MQRLLSSIVERWQWLVREHPAVPAPSDWNTQDEKDHKSIVYLDLAVTTACSSTQPLPDFHLHLLPYVLNRGLGRLPLRRKQHHVLTAIRHKHRIGAAMGSPTWHHSATLTFLLMPSLTFSP